MCRCRYVPDVGAAFLVLWGGAAGSGARSSRGAGTAQRGWAERRWHAAAVAVSAGSPRCWPTTERGPSDSASLFASSDPFATASPAPAIFALPSECTATGQQADGARSAPADESRRAWLDIERRDGTHRCSDTCRKHRWKPLTGQAAAASQMRSSSSSGAVAEDAQTMPNNDRRSCRMASQSTECTRTAAAIHERKASARH